MAGPRLRTITVPVLWIAVAALLWLLGAMVFFMAAEAMWDALVPAALFAATVVGVVLARRSRRGHLLLAAAGLASAIWCVPRLLEGGFFSTLIAAAGLVVATTALIAWRTPRPSGAGGGGRPRVIERDRSFIELCLAWSLGIAGVLLLARAALELVQGLAELPGASEHWAGDVMMWLIFVLPIPLILGATEVAAARWLRRRRISDRTALAGLTLLVGGALAWIVVWTSQGAYVHPFEDPLLWPPVTALAGVALGVAVAAVEWVRMVRTPRAPRGTGAPQPRPS